MGVFFSFSEMRQLPVILHIYGFEIMPVYKLRQKNACKVLIGDLLVQAYEVLFCLESFLPEVMPLKIELVQTNERLAIEWLLCIRPL
jgi:hypothetical protein